MICSRAWRSVRGWREGEEESDAPRRTKKEGEKDEYNSTWIAKERRGRTKRLADRTRADSCLYCGGSVSEIEAAMATDHLVPVSQTNGSSPSQSVYYLDYSGGGANGAAQHRSAMASRLLPSRLSHSPTSPTHAKITLCAALLVHHATLVCTSPPASLSHWFCRPSRQAHVFSSGVTSLRTDVLVSIPKAQVRLGS